MWEALQKAQGTGDLPACEVEAAALPASRPGDLRLWAPDSQPPLPADPRRPRTGDPLTLPVLPSQPFLLQPQELPQGRGPVTSCKWRKYSSDTLIYKHSGDLYLYIPGP